MITALEGERILSFILDEGMEDWFARHLAAEMPIRPPSGQPMTMPDSACRELKSAIRISRQSRTPVPFLIMHVQNLSRSAVRLPLFCLREALQPGEAALILTIMFRRDGNMQIVEHLGQNEYWGNMTDILLALCDISRYTTLRTASTIGP